MLSREDYRARDALGLADLVRTGEVTAREVLDAAIGEMDRLDQTLNAIVMRNDEKARDDAESLDIMAPLAGVPFPAKDINVHIAGFRTTYGCRFFADAPAETVDSLLVSRWRAAGLVVAARTNTPEFATDFGCEPEFYGPTHNPWDWTRTPGGSSGGAAAAVASGMVPMAHASDSGGSIRVPAACCGVFGFKPSSGLVATGSAFGALVGGLNTDHAITWTVRDSAALLDATAGPEAGTPLAYAKPDGSFLAALDRPVGPMRIGVVAVSPTGQAPVSEMAGKLDVTSQLLTELGHEVRHWTWPTMDHSSDAATAFWAGELAATIADRAATIGRAPRDGELGPLVTWSVAEAARIDSVGVSQARRAMRSLQIRMAKAFDDIDVLLTPVTGEPPLENGILTACVERSIECWSERAYRFAPYTEIFNITGQPAMSVPLHRSEDRLPIGMQFAGKVGDDARLMRLARQLEEATPWFRRRPPHLRGQHDLSAQALPTARGKTGLQQTSS